MYVKFHYYSYDRESQNKLVQIFYAYLKVKFDNLPNLLKNPTIICPQFATRIEIQTIKLR